VEAKPGDAACGGGEPTRESNRDRGDGSFVIGCFSGVNLTPEKLLADETHSVSLVRCYLIAPSIRVVGEKIA
jgi:hypothetical protein